MKKLFALTMVLVMAVSMLCMGVSAEYDDMVRVLMTSEHVEVFDVKWNERVDESVLNECLDKLDPEQIPEECTVKSGRITIMEQGRLSYSDEIYDVYDVTFKVWSTLNRTICLFFLADGAEEWEMLSCNLGDVIEGRFWDNGIYAIAVAW